ncbi:hypothetical protein C8R47DRAFT_1203262 [Mycena vitilis]|nr:hypothetical protein C8R47DRAFT_1203262 [Mycena vitilis]
MMFFSSSLLVLALSAFAVGSPTPSPNEVARQDSSPNSSVVPLTLNKVLGTLNQAVLELGPGIGEFLCVPMSHDNNELNLDAIVAASGPEGQLPSASVVPLLEQLAGTLTDSTGQLAAVGPGNMGAADEDIGKLVESILNELNDALNKLVPKLGLNGVLTPLDGALTGLLTGLSPVLGPVVAAVGAILVPVGGVVGGLLATLNLSALFTSSSTFLRAALCFEPLFYSVSAVSVVGGSQPQSQLYVGAVKFVRGTIFDLNPEMAATGSSEAPLDPSPPSPTYHVQKHKNVALRTRPKNT